MLKLAPFLSILVGTFAAGFAAGLPLEAVASAFSKGAGALLGDVGIIIALGAMLGALMAESGAADRLVSTILKHSTPRTAALDDGAGGDHHRLAAVLRGRPRDDGADHLRDGAPLASSRSCVSRFPRWPA